MAYQPSQGVRFRGAAGRQGPGQGSGQGRFAALQSEPVEGFDDDGIAEAPGGNNADYRIDADTELAPALAIGQTVVSMKEFPEEFHFREGMEASAYHSDLDFITKRYDGRDAPGPEKLKHPKYPGLSMAGKSNVITRINDFGKHFGEGLMTSKDRHLKPWLKLEVELNSQHPSIKLRIMGPAQSGDVVCHFFPGCLSRDEESFVNMRVIHNGDAGSHCPAEMTEVHERLRENSLVEYRFQLWAPETVDGSNVSEPVHRGIPPERPVWSGISAQELQACIDEWRTPGAADTMTASRQLIALLCSTTDVSIFRAWPDGGAAELRAFREYFNATWSVTGAYGYNWFYQLQTDTSITSVDCEHEDLQQPRWLATQMLVETRDDVKAFEDKFVSAKPYKVSAFQPLRQVDTTRGGMIYPNPHVKAFDFLLAICRNQARQSFVARSAFADNAYKITARMSPHHTYAGRYFVSVWPGESRVLTTDRSLRPDPGTRVVLWVKADAGGHHRFSGEVIDDVFNTGTELALLVEGPTLPEREAGLAGNEEYFVAVECVDDPTPSGRWRAAVQELLGGQTERTVGVDVKHLVLQSPQTIANTGALASQVTPQAAQAADNVAIRRGLNTEQRQANTMSYSTATGLLSLLGPPGCGKSETLGAMAESQLLIGQMVGKKRQVLVTAPSNFAVAEVCKKFKAKLPRGFEPEIVVFKGDFLHEKKEKRLVPDPDAMDIEEEDVENFDIERLPNEPRSKHRARWQAELQRRRAERAQREADREVREEEAADLRPLWDMADEIGGKETGDVNEEFAFHSQRLKAIRSWAASAGTANPHPLHEVARGYLDARNRVKNKTGGDADQRADDRRSMDGYMKKCNKYYLQRTVDIVFCTNSTAAHPLLRADFKPVVLLEDEAAQTNVPDAITPLAAFIETVEVFIQAGDHMQHRPMVSSQGFNEHVHVLSRSLFELTITNGMYENSFISLRRQHRMHPEIAEFPRVAFYNNQLDDDDSVKTTSAKWVTMADFLAKSGIHNGRRRVAIAVNSASHRPEDGTSWANDSEGEVICGLIAAAVTHPPPPGGAQLEYSDFLVLAFYQAQVRLLRQKVNANRMRGVEVDDRVEILNTRVCQGGEGRFVILSWAKNIPGSPLKLGFTTDPHGICVALTRAREGLFMVGNFKGWVQKYVDGTIALTSNKGSMSVFGKLVNDCWTKGDILASDDLASTLLQGQPALDKGTFADSIVMPDAGTMESRSLRQPGGRAQTAFDAMDRQNAENRRAGRYAPGDSRRDGHGGRGQGDGGRGGRGQGGRGRGRGRGGPPDMGGNGRRRGG